MYNVVTSSYACAVLEIESQSFLLHSLGRVHARFRLPDESLDIVILIFVLSALHPDELKAAIKKIAKVLKPGGQSKILLSNQESARGH